MAKKASKSKATRRPARKLARREIVDDPSTPLFNGVALESFPRPFKPLSAARQRAWRREKEGWMAEQRSLAAAREAEHDARLATRPASMQGRYQLPPDVRRFVSRVYGEWRLYHGPVGRHDEPPLPVDAVSHLMEAAYMEGCRQGFIEGFVERRMPDKKRSDTGNAAKRKTLVELPDGRRMTRDERDTLMVAEYQSLLTLKWKPTPAMERLAEKYGFESWQGVAAAMKSFGKRSAR